MAEPTEGDSSVAMTPTKDLDTIQLIREPQTKIQWIAHFAAVDRAVKEKCSPGMSRRARVSKIFGILQGLCENPKVTESLEPFQAEYLELHAELRKKKRAASAGSIGEEVIGYLLLEKVEDNLALLDEADQSLSKGENRVVGSRDLGDKISPPDQLVSRIPRRGPVPSRGASPDFTPRPEGATVAPAQKGSTAKFVPPKVSPGVSALPVKATDVKKKDIALTDVGPGKAIGTPSEASAQAPRPNRVSILRAQKVVGEKPDNASAKKRGMSDTYQLGGSLKHRGVGNDRKSSAPLPRRSIGFENDDPFVDDPNKVTPIPPRFARALAEIRKSGIPAIRNPKNRQSGAVVDANCMMEAGKKPQEEPTILVTKASIASSLISTPGRAPFVCRVDSEEARYISEYLLTDSDKSFATSSSALAVASMRSKMRPSSYAGNPNKLMVGYGSRRFSVDCRMTRENFDDVKTSPVTMKQAVKILPKKGQGKQTAQVIDRNSKVGGAGQQNNDAKGRSDIKQEQMHRGRGGTTSVAHSSSRAPIAADRRASTTIQGPKQSDLNQPREESKPNTHVTRAMAASCARGSPSSSRRPAATRDSDNDNSRQRRNVSGGAQAKRAPNPALTAPSSGRRDAFTTPPMKSHISPALRHQAKKPSPLGSKPANITGKALMQQSQYVYGHQAPTASDNRSMGLANKSLAPAGKPPISANRPAVPNNKENIKPSKPCTTGSPSGIPVRATPKPSPVPSSSAKPLGDISGIGASRNPRTTKPLGDISGAGATRNPGADPAAVPKPLADISEIGASRNPRTNIGRKWLGLRKSQKAGENDLETGKNKENVHPSARNVPTASHSYSKGKKLLGVTNWFRNENRASNGSTFAGKHFLKFSKASAPGNRATVDASSTPGFGFSEEEVKALKNRLSTHYPSKSDGFNVVGGQYYTSKVPTMDQSPSRHEKDANPIAVCMELINSASTETDPLKRDNLFAMSRILVDAVTRSKDAQCASEKAILAAKEAKVATATAEQAQREVFAHLRSVVEMISTWKHMGKIMLSA